MLKSRPKKLFHFLVFYGFSLIALFVIAISVNLATLPDVTIWIKKNPDRSFFVQKYNIPESQIKYRYASLKKIPQRMIDCILLAEDASFYIHEGIDWFEFRQSMLKNLKSGKFSRGASTITQQVVKNIFLSNEKKVSRKLKEILITRDLEQKLKKRRILELYLNIAEYDKNVYGIEAAAKHYYNRSSSDLILSEMIQLAAILPSPKKLNPTKLNNALKWRCRVLTERLFFYNKIDEPIYLALKELYRK